MSICRVSRMERSINAYARITFYLDEISFFLQFYKVTLINKIS